MSEMRIGKEEMIRALQIYVDKLFLLEQSKVIDFRTIRRGKKYEIVMRDLEGKKSNPITVNLLAAMEKK